MARSVTGSLEGTLRVCADCATEVPDGKTRCPACGKKNLVKRPVAAAAPKSRIEEPPPPPPPPPVEESVNPEYQATAAALGGGNGGNSDTGATVLDPPASADETSSESGPQETVSEAPSESAPSESAPSETVSEAPSDAAVETISEAPQETSSEATVSEANESSGTPSETATSVEPAGEETIADLPVVEGSTGIGRKLGDYILEKKIGQGGMGEVFRARQVSLDRVVAIKILPKALSAQPGFVERFQREAKAAAGLIHPNVIQMYSYGIDDGRPYFAMEYVEGEDLSQRLKRQRQLPFGEIAEIVGSIASALSVAHDKGVVHRDIKPSNVMIDRNGFVKVMDFGLAKATSGGTELTQSGMIMGTPNYLSPEQGRGDPLDGRSDLYSLGVVLYEMLTTTLPFKADTPAGLIFKHVYEEPEAPTSRNPEVPQELEKVALDLLAKAPEDRPASAKKVVDSLKRFSRSTGGEVAEAPAPAEEAAPAEAAPAAGGDQTEVDTERPKPKKAPAPAARKKPAPQPVDEGDLPPPQPTQTIIIERQGLGAIWVLIVLIVVGGGGLGFLVLKQQGMLAGIGVPPGPQPGPTPPIGPVAGVRPVSVKAPWQPADLRGGQVFLELASGRTPLPNDVLPASGVKVSVERSGYDPLSFTANVDDRGELVDARDQKPLGQKPLEWTPGKDFRETYDSALAALKAAEDEARAVGVVDRTKLIKAKSQLEGDLAKGLDGGYRRASPAGTKPEDLPPTAEEVVKRAGELLKKTEGIRSDGPEKAKKLVEGKKWRELASLVEDQGSLKDSPFWQKQATTAKENLAQAETLAKDCEVAVLKGDVKDASDKLAALREQDPEDKGKDRIERLAKVVEPASKNRPAALDAAKAAQGEVALTAARKLLDDYTKLIETLGSSQDREVLEASRGIVDRILQAQSLAKTEGDLKTAMDKRDWALAQDLANGLKARDATNKVVADALPRIEAGLREAEIATALRRLDEALKTAGDRPEAVLALIDDAQLLAKEKKAFEELRVVQGKIVSSRHDGLKVEARGDTFTVSARWVLELSVFGEPPQAVELKHTLSLKKVGQEWRIAALSATR